MIFKKLKIKNIRSYKEMEIEFPKGSILLSGDIGAGKTSVLLALQFALFGLQPGQKGGSVLRQGETDAEVELELEIDGKNIIIERSLKRSKNQSISQESSIIIIDGERYELSTSEMKTKIITLLNYPKEFVKKSNLLYKFTVYTPQEEMKAIIQERPDIRLDTLRHVFGIDRYKRIKENSEILLQKIKESIKVKEAEILELFKLKEKFTLETESKIQLSREINNLNIEHQKLVKEKNEAEQKLNSMQKLIDEKQKLDSELGKIKISLQGKKEIKTRMEREISLMQRQIQEKIDFSEERLQQVSSLLDKHKVFLEEFNVKLLNLSSRISVLNSKKDESLKLKEKIMKLENCPTCFQKVADEHKDKISKRTQFDIEDLNRELEQRFAEKRQLLKDIDSEKEIIKGYEQDRNSLEQNKIRFQHRKIIETKIKSDVFVLENSKTEIQEFENKVSEINTKLESYKETGILFEKSKKALDVILQKVQQEQIRLAEKNKELEILMKRLDELQENIISKEKIREQINHFRSLQDWMQEKFLSIITLTEKNVMAKLRNEFSKIFSEWFSMLVSEDLIVRLDEDFTPIITNQDYEIDYDFLSGGERTAVALAYRLALNQVLNSLLSRIKTKGVVILDEPTDGFSEEQLDKMREIFNQLKSEQTILVSHEQKMEGFVDHIIRIKKDVISGIEETE